MPNDRSLDPAATVPHAPGPVPESTGENTRKQFETPALPGQPQSLPAVPGFAVTREIARGGMGVVYAAHDPVFDREVAIKVMHPGQDGERFVIESKVTAQLPHPGIPPVHALGALTDGRPFLAMKLVAGRTLAGELRASGPTDLPRLLGAFEQICQTVGFAHARGIIHRDLKPSNVMIGPFGEVLVMDWGLAKQGRSGQRAAGSEEANRLAAPQKEAADESQAGHVKGTPAYMAPEQARGEPVDARADVFALGGILCSVLTGKAPFGGTTVRDTIRQAARAELGETFARLNACGADAELVAVAKACLAADAADRFPDGRAVADAVAAYRSGVEERLRTAERQRAAAEAKAAEEANTRRETEARAAEQRKRRKVQQVLTAAVLLLIAGVAAFLWWRNDQANERAVAEGRAESERLRIDRDRQIAEARAETEAGLKRQQAGQGIDAGLVLATDLRKQYKFKAATDALAQAEALAKGGAPERLEEVKRAQSDLVFVIQLDDVRYRKWIWLAVGGGKGVFNTKIAAPEYRKTFAAHGLDLTTLAPAAAAGRIAARAVKADLVAAVDDWAIYETDDALRERLLETARLADRGAWTDRLRTPDVRKDKAAMRALAAEVDPTRTPPAVLSVLARLMARRQLDPAPMLTTARATHPNDFELACVTGEVHHNSKSGQQIGPYEAARALRPESVVVWNNLGLALAARGDSAGAIAAHRKAMELDPQNAIPHNNLGVALYGTGDPDGAIAAFQKAIGLDPKFALAHTNLGFALYGKGDLVGAIAKHKKALELDPEFTAALLNLGHALDDNGDRVGAVAAYQKAVAVDPRFAKAHTSLGIVLAGTGDLAGAIAAHRKAIDVDPEYALAHGNLGVALVEKGDLAGAVAAFEKALELDPTDAHALTSLGAVWADRGDLNGAILAHKRAIKLDPRNAQPYYNLGTALYGAGDLAGSIAALEKAIQLAPKNAKARTNLGVALVGKGDPAGAVAAHQKAIELDPKFALARFNLGVALAGTGDTAGAIAAYKKAIELDPTFVLAHANLGVIYYEQNKYAEAVTCARAAIRADPKYSNAHALLGSALQRSGDIPGARAALREAVRLDKQWVPLLADLPPVPVAPPPREVARP